MPDEYNLLDAHKGRKYCSLDNARTTIRRMMALQAGQGRGMIRVVIGKGFRGGGGAH